MTRIKFNNGRFDIRRIIVTMLILMNVVLFYLPQPTRAFPVSKRLLDQVENIVSDEYKGTTDHTKILHHLRRQKRVGHLKEVLIYLRKYGYINDNRPLTTDYVEEALRAFQKLAGIAETGKVTRLTLDKMHAARCGNVDVSSSPGRHRKRFAQVSKWMNKMDRGDILKLKWFIEKYTEDIPVNQIKDTVSKAFKLWADQASLPSMRTVRLSFAEAHTAAESDIEIMWAVGDHGDNYPFDGAGNTSNILAHTFYPNYQESGRLNGNIHFDDYENWVLDNQVPIEEGVYFPYVLTHEIGHALGLGHSNRQEAVMNPIYKQTSFDKIFLDIDDKCAINWNYIGPSNTCLFVWLMVEFLPKIPKDNNQTSSDVVGNKSPPTGSSTIGSPPDPYKTNRIGELTVNKKINKLFQSLQQTDIPLCNDDNTVQFEYEELLMKKLNFARHDAHVYSDTVCNFAAGLSNVLESRIQRQLQQYDQTYTRHTPLDHSRLGHSRHIGGPLQMTVHSYPTSFYSSVDITDSSDSHPHTAISAETVYSKDHFDEKFFANILRLFVERR